MSIVVPELGPGGFITDTPHQLSTMFAHALVSDYSQSTIYAGKVTSIAFLVAQYQNNQADMAAELEASLQTYYGRVFKDVEVIVTYSEVINDSYQLFVSIKATVNGVIFSLAAVASVDNGVLSIVLKEINQ